MRALCQLCQSVSQCSHSIENKTDSSCTALLHWSHLFALQHSLLSLTSVCRCGGFNPVIRLYFVLSNWVEWLVWQSLKGICRLISRYDMRLLRLILCSYYKVISSFQTLKQQRLKSACQSPVVTLIYRPRTPYMLHKFLNLKSISKHLKTNSLFSSVFEYEYDKTSFHKFITDE